MSVCQSVTLCGHVQKELNTSSSRFGLWAQMGRRNRVLDEDLEVLRDVAMATN